MFWTVPTAGGTAIKTEIDPTIEKQVEVSTGPKFPFAAAPSEGTAEDFQLPWVSFSWSPSGNAIYFERLFRGTINIWKMTIDPRSLQATALDRLSTGPGPDVGVAISHDGKRLAFTAKSQHRRTRLFPFDASTHRLSGEGQPITAAGRAAAYPVLSRDGNRLAFSTPLDNGRWELWQKSLVDGREGPVITDDYSRIPGRWSFDGTQLAYNRSNTNENKSQLMVWSRQSRSEQPLTSTSSDIGALNDWSPDGKWLLVSKAGGDARGNLDAAPCFRTPRGNGGAKDCFRSQIRFVAGTFLPEWPVDRVSGRRQLAYFVGIIYLRGASGRWYMDPHNERNTLGRQASLVSRWEDDLLYFGRWWIFQFMGNPL